LEGNILEIGAGTGYTTLALAKAGYKFISIDKDRESLKIAALNLAYENLLSNVKFYIMDGREMTFENGSFKSVVCVNLFHHVNKNNVNKILSEIDRVLCVNGKIILADFNKKGMEIVNTVHKQENRVHENSGITKDNIYSYFQKLGYEIKDYEEKCHWLLIAKKIIYKGGEQPL
jgi:ubiquinone/menaquinone biosynthesis C-methylase UbiE